MIATMSERLIMNVFEYSRSQDFFSAMMSQSGIPGPSLSDFSANAVSE